jgi:hypothetical protein
MPDERFIKASEHMQQPSAVRIAELGQYVEPAAENLLPIAIRGPASRTR